MFGIGLTEILVVLAVALIVIGPERLPELASKLGAMLGDIKRAAGELKHAVSGDPDIRDNDRDAGDPEGRETEGRGTGGGKGQGGRP